MTLISAAVSKIEKWTRFKNDDNSKSIHFITRKVYRKFTRDCTLHILYPYFLSCQNAYLKDNYVEQKQSTLITNHSSQKFLSILTRTYQNGF